jgi:hypothetical protein
MSLGMRVSAQNPGTTVTVDTALNRHSISPNIYGVAYGTTATLADLNSPLNRYGGNNTSRYNWQLNADNRGQDWYFESIGDTSATAGERGDTFFSTSKAAGAQALLTIPMIGWVGKLAAGRNKLASFSIAKYGAQTGNDWQWFPDAGNGVLSSGKNVIGNDPNDANVPADSTYQQSWVQHLVSTWGQSAKGGVGYYLLDNESSIWFSTHRDVHPTGATMAEIEGKMLDYSAKIKAIDPTAQVMGPEEWGWSGYFYSGYDQQYGSLNGWGSLPDRASHGGQDYLPWLLSQLKASGQSSGVHPIDVFSVHYYPQSGEFSNDVSNATQLLRNQSTRSLWDPNYVDQSWINDKVQLIPRLKNWVSTYYFPGTPVAITEYNWGAEPYINGATTQADIYGIFGREGLDMATRWTTPDPSTPTYLAMKMYRNYDGSKSTFGDTSVSATVANPDNLSAFAAQRSVDGALTVMVINKVLTGNTPVAITLNNFPGSGVGHVYQLTSTNSIQHLSDVAYSGTSLNLTVPPQSITLLVLAENGVTCNPGLTPGSRLFAFGGGSGSVTVADGGGCEWSATTDSPGWINLTGPSGFGPGAFSYTVAPNAGPARMGTVSVGAKSFKVMQGGAAAIFNDVPATDSNFDYVSLMYSNGITAGCSTTPPLYCPTTPVTRAQMAVFVVAGLDIAMKTSLTYTPTPYFQDMPSSSNYFPFVQRIKDLGITAGCSTSPPLYCPDSTITQGQMAVFMITGWMLANNLTTFTYTTTPYFTDVPATDPFFKFVQKMKDLGFNNGCTATTYCENSAVTRDGMAPMVMRSLLGAP